MFRVMMRVICSPDFTSRFEVLAAPSRPAVLIDGVFESVACGICWLAEVRDRARIVIA